MGQATIKARALARWRIVRDVSDAGGSMDDAARAVGLTVGGVRNMLRRHTGSGEWPVPPDAQ